jgi:hypothetical protein
MVSGLALATATDSQAAIEARRGAAVAATDGSEAWGLAANREAGPVKPKRSSLKWCDGEVAKEERAVLLGRLAAARGSLGRAQAEAAREAREVESAGFSIEEAPEVALEKCDSPAMSAMETCIRAQLKSSVEKDKMEVNKTQAAAAEQVAGLQAEIVELETHLKALRAFASTVQSRNRVLELSLNDNKKKGEVYKQQMEVKLREQMKELESLQSSKVDQKHSALFTEMAGLE